MTATTTQQITVEIEDEPGTLADVAEALAEEGINILGFACTAPGGQGTATFTTDEARQATRALQRAGYAPRVRESVFASAPNEPGELARLARQLADSGVNIEASFAQADPRGSGVGIGFQVDDTKQALEVLQG